MLAVACIPDPQQLSGRAAAAVGRAGGAAGGDRPAQLTAAPAIRPPRACLLAAPLVLALRNVVGFPLRLGGW